MSEIKVLQFTDTKLNPWACKIIIRYHKTKRGERYIINHIIHFVQQVRIRKVISLVERAWNICGMDTMLKQCQTPIVCH